MVTATFTYPEVNRRWLKYVALSIVVNLLVISAININNQPVLSQEMPMLKVSLMSLAAPSAPPVSPPISQPPAPVISKKVVAQRQADTKVAASKPLREDSVQPATVKPQPITPTPQKKQVDAPKLAPQSADNGRQASSAIHEANYRKQTPPIYPRRALELGQEGVVTLHAEVMPSGLPRELKIAKSSGHRLLDMAALSAVKKWEFEPTRVNGSTVNSWVRVPVRFVIQ